MATQATNIFISYGRKDSRDLAMRLRDDLMGVGYSVWLDLNEIPGGADWSQQIEDAIEHCHILIALLSPASFHSQWCRAEQLRAMRKGKRLVPLMVIENAEVPLHLEHLNYLDFTDRARYSEMFRDLLSDITAGIAFKAPSVASYGQGGGMSPTPYAPVAVPDVDEVGYSDEKRTAPGYRRFLRQLRQEPWLGARFWWPYFLFNFTDLTNVVDILQAGELRSKVGQGGDFSSRWDRDVTLYFRPRTPDLYHAEGFRSTLANVPDNYASIPVYLLFDLEAVILQPEARFADGNPAQTGKTFSTPSYFSDLPFEQIYHDSWFTYDEREEIMRFREAQVLLPDKIGLEALQLIWVRSEAEYETLQTLMPTDVWHKWRDKITARTDYHLFNNKRLYVQNASLQPDHIRLRFNPCQVDCQPFMASAKITYGDSEVVEWHEEEVLPQRDLVINLPREGTYTVKFYLDKQLAYAGRYMPELMVL